MNYNTRVSHLIPLIKRALSEEMLPDIEDAKQAAAEELLDCIREDYTRKSLGQRGVDGIQWTETQAFLKDRSAMLVRTGALFNSFEIEMTPTGFKIFTDLIYARRQFSLRPAWPDDHLPAEWLSRMLNKAKPYLLKAFAAATRQAVEESGMLVEQSSIR